MKTRIGLLILLALAFMVPVASMILAQQAGGGRTGRPQGSCDVYAAGGTPCVAAHSTTRALYASYNGPLYQVLRQSDGKTLDIGVVQPSGTDGGGYADAAAQDAFCANTFCFIATVYDQSGHKNDLTQAPRGGTGNPTMMGGFNALPIADMAPVTVMGHKAYGIFIESGMGLRNDNPHGTAVDDQAEGQYWVINGHHYNSGCCFDYGNAEIDSRDDDAGTMETTYYGNAKSWYHGPGDGPWVMTDQENNLVGCVTTDGTKNCDLPIITWRFVTGTADGEPHHWRSMGGDAQSGELKVMFDGKRVNNQYDPMRKQGAIDMGNGGDNSNDSDGTIYEAAMTAAGTFPSQETQQKVQANVVAAHYDAPRLMLAPASAVDTPPGLQTFSPGSTQDTTVTFTNTTGAPATGVRLSIALPTGWTAVATGPGVGLGAAATNTKTFNDPIAPGATVSAVFKVTSGPAAFNGDLIARASWTANGHDGTDTMAEKARNVSPIKINEVASSFIELYNAGTADVDLSNWSVTEHASQQAIFSSVKIPAGTRVAGKGFYLLGLSDSGLAVPAKKGDGTIYVRSTAGMNVGDTIEIDTGAGMETRKIATLGTAAGPSLTVWQPLPDGPVITIPAGATSVPVSGVGGLTVGEKVAIGYGATYPVIAKDIEKYEIATVTEVGKAGTQSRLSAAANVGDTSIRVMNAGNISVGDKISLDVDSVGHGVETVTIKSLNTPAPAGGAPGARGGPGAMAPAITTPDDPTFFTAAPAGPPAATAPGGRGGRGGRGGLGGGRGGATVELAAPLKFNHASNLPFSDRGTGVSFKEASAFPHSTNEPVLPLGTGITLDKPLDGDHDINAVVRDAANTIAGYQGGAKPNVWFGGPAIGNSGNVVLRDAGGLVADSLNYGHHVDPWAGEGYQATSGPLTYGCRAPSPVVGNGGRGRGAPPPTAGTPTSTGRITDGGDNDSNCNDFALETATPGAPNQALPAAPAAPARNGGGRGARGPAQ